MPSKIPSDWLEVLSADEAREQDKRLGFATGDPIYLDPGTHYIYWNDPARDPLRGVYNIPAGMVDTVVARIENNRSASYEDLVGDVKGAGYADQKTQIKIIGDEEDDAS